jgi:stress response protein YsnF
VQREEFEVVREPVTDAARGDGSDLRDDEIDVAVHEERPVIDKEVVATEQVGVDRRVVTDERDVTTDVSREEVDVVEDDTDTGRRI